MPFQEPRRSSRPRSNVATALDVIEHIEVDAAALRDVGRLLVPRGWLIVTMPARGLLWSGHDEVNHHYQRYTGAGLQAPLHTNGFEVVHRTYFNTWLSPAVAATRLIGRLIPARAPKNDMRRPTPLVNRVLRSMFVAESRLVVRCSWPFGLSILAVARRRK